MKYIRYNANELEDMYLFLLGDLHNGSKTTDMPLFKTYLDKVDSMPNARIILMGDLVEYAGRASPGNSLWEQTGNPQAQLDWMFDTFEPYADKIIATVGGNHEARIKKQTGIDTMKTTAKHLNIPYVPRAGVARIQLADRAFSVFMTHGAGSGKTPELKMRRLREAAAIVQGCDIYCMGHHHTNTNLTMVVKEPDLKLKKMVDKEILLQMTGAFLKFDDSYAEEVMMVPTVIGSPIIRLNSDGFKSLNIEDLV